MGQLMVTLSDQCLAWDMGPARIAMRVWPMGQRWETLTQEAWMKARSLGLGACETVRLIEGPVEGTDKGLWLGLDNLLAMGADDGWDDMDGAGDRLGFDDGMSVVVGI